MELPQLIIQMLTLPMTKYQLQNYIGFILLLEVPYKLEYHTQSLKFHSLSLIILISQNQQSLFKILFYTNQHSSKNSRFIAESYWSNHYLENELKYQQVLNLYEQFMHQINLLGRALSDRGFQLIPILKTYNL